MVFDFLHDAIEDRFGEASGVSERPGINVNYVKALVALVG